MVKIKRLIDFRPMSRQSKPNVQKGLVSVIVTCYNLGEYLGEALESLKIQTYSPIEVIVVDDGSTESKTKETIKKLQEKYKDFKFYSISNRGVGGARNFGIIKSRGEYVCVLDADDIFKPKYIEKCVEFLESNAKHTIVTTYAKTFGKEEINWKTEGYNKAKLCTINLLHVSSLFRRKVFDAIGGYCRTLSGYQDWDYWLGAVERGFSWGLVSEQLFHYRIREQSMLSGSRKNDALLFSLLCRRHMKIYRDCFVEIIMMQRKDNRHLVTFGNDMEARYEQCRVELQDAIKSKDDCTRRLDQMAQVLKDTEAERGSYLKENNRLKYQSAQYIKERNALQSELNTLNNSRYLRLRGLLLSTRTFSGMVRLPKKVLMILFQKAQ